MTPGGSSKAPRRFGISSTITGTNSCARHALRRKTCADSPDQPDDEDAAIEQVGRFIVAADADRRIDPNAPQGRDGNADRTLVRSIIPFLYNLDGKFMG